ncbi:ribosome maturation factor RimP [bacterium]|nr:MAG: ribosome maturation factor RimP [bacterium]
MGVSPTSLRLGTFFGVTISKDRLAHARSIADRVARDFGLEIFDVQLQRESIGWVLRIFIDKVVQSDMTTETNNSEAVTVEDCQRVSTDVSAVLDVEFSFEHAYTLEVSSPGLDRPLRHAADCHRFIGRLAKFVVAEAINGQKFLSGRIVGVEEISTDSSNEKLNHIVIKTGRNVARIPWSIVTRAHLEVEL